MHPRSASIVRKMSYTNELWYTIPHHLQPNYTRNKSMACTGTPETSTGTPETKEEKEKKNTEKERKRKDTETKETKRKKKRSKHVLRAQVESLGDKVAVCWHDQSCDVSS